jgi:hypothetical protein
VTDAGAAPAFSSSFDGSGASSVSSGRGYGYDGGYSG